MARNKAVWLAQLLWRRGPLSKEDILECWRAENEYGQRMAESTFYDQRRLLAERYGVELRREGGLYSLDARREQTGCPSKADGMPFWCGAVAEGDGLDPAPAGSCWWAVADQALTERRVVSMRYAPFDKPAYDTLLRPYCLRVSGGRCYVVGHSSRHGEVRTFALDRVTAFVLTVSRFKADASFDARAYFRYSFGMFGGPGMNPAHVVLRATERVAPYLLSRPLHVSQRTEALPDGGLRVELDVALTDDFVAALLSYGASLRVESPQELRRRLHRAAMDVAEQTCEED